MKLKTKYEILKIQRVDDLLLRSIDEETESGFYYEEIFFLVFWRERKNSLSDDGSDIINIYPVTEADFDERWIVIGENVKIGLGGTGIIERMKHPDKEHFYSDLLSGKINKVKE